MVNRDKDSADGAANFISALQFRHCRPIRDGGAAEKPPDCGLRFKNFVTLTASLGVFAGVAFCPCATVCSSAFGLRAKSHGCRSTRCPAGGMAVGRFPAMHALQFRDYHQADRWDALFIFWWKAVVISCWPRTWRATGVCPALPPAPWICVFYFHIHMGYAVAGTVLASAIFDLAIEWVRPSLKTGRRAGARRLRALAGDLIATRYLAAGHSRDSGWCSWRRPFSPHRPAAEVIQEAESAPAPGSAARLLGKLVLCGI